MCGIVGYVGEAALDDCRDLQALAGELSGHRDVLFIGRGSNHPIALEAGVEAEGDLVPIAVANTGDDTTTWQVSHVLRVPAAPSLLQPFLTVLPLQMLSYAVALAKGNDVDQPRNLAKSVTVE